MSPDLFSYTEPHIIKAFPTKWASPFIISMFKKHSLSNLVSVHVYMHIVVP